MADVPTFERVTLVGLGVIGGSLAACLKKTSPEISVAGVSSPRTLNAAEKKGLIDSGYGYGDPAAFAEADLVILCTPISVILDQLEQWRRSPPAVRKPCLIMDVGSTKREICEKGQNAFTDHPHLTFLGSHPMAGSEKSGLDALDPHLFENAAWILCPSSDAEDKAVKTAGPFLEALGARVSLIPPDIHDQVAAHFSHLPQLLSTALAGHIASNAFLMENGLPISGTGFYDMTRLANSSWDMWQPIIKTNRRQIHAALEQYITYLESMKTALDTEDTEPFFTSGRFLREKMFRHNAGFIRGISEVMVTVPDRPRVLESIIAALSGESLNIVDLEVLKVREGEGGTLKIAFKKPEEAERAVDCLLEKKFKAQLKK